MNLSSQLDQLENAQLIRRLIEEELPYTFRHALTQESAYESLLKNQRREIHRAVAQTIETLYPDQLDENAARLAQHYAEARDDGKMIEYALRAGDVAAKIFAYPEARIHYALALEAIARLPDNEENRRRRVDALIKQVTVSLRSAGPAETLKRLAEAENIAQEFAGRTDATRQDRVRLAQIHFWQGHALLHHGDARASLEKMQTVMTVAQAENELPLLAVSASVIGRSLTVRGEFPKAIAVLSDAVTALEQTHDEHEWIFAVGLRGFAMAMQGDIARGVAEAERTLAFANQVGSLQGISISHFVLALTHIFCDAIPTALEHGRAVIETSARSGDRLHAVMGYGYLAWAQTLANQLDEAEKNFAQMKSIAQTMGGRVAFGDAFTLAHAALYYRRGEYAQAISTAQQSIAISQAAAGIFFPGLAHRLWAESLIKSPAINQSDIENHFAESLRMLTECDAQVEIARTHAAWGKFLHERGDAKLAREHLEHAVAQFEKSGLTRELKETRAMLAQ